MSRFVKWARILVVIILLVAIAGSIHFTSRSRSQVTIVEQVFRDVLSSVQRLFMRVSRSINHFFTSIAQIGDLREENEQLKAEVLELQQQLYLMAEYKRENEWLREALDFREQHSFSMQIAEVIGRTPTNLFSTITINRGEKHGVSSGMAVMSGTGVVGTVQSVSNYTATVLLATDSRSAIGGMVQDTGDLVLIEGDPDYSGMLLAKPLSKDVKLEVGDLLVTSGLSQHFPKGMPVGKVVEVVPNRYQLSFTAYVQPIVDYTRLEYVVVLLNDTE